MVADLNGLLLINKPSGCTSHDVVARARKILKTKSIGHTGTLDPLASGLMVLLVGQATKLSDFFLKGNKGYRVRIKLGIVTDSLDTTGKILSEKNTSHLSEEKVLEKIKFLQGHHVLPIPAFSAKKVDGVKMCEMARKGEKVPEIEKDMFFYDLQVIAMDVPFVELSFSCSKGSFVRSWVQKLGELLQVGAIVQELERTYSEPYDLKNAISLEKLEGGELGAAWIPLNQTLLDWPGIIVNPQEQHHVQNGLIPGLLSSRIRTSIVKGAGGVRLLTPENRLLSLIERAGNSEAPDFKIRRVFPQT